MLGMLYTSPTETSDCNFNGFSERQVRYIKESDRRLANWLLLATPMSDLFPNRKKADSYQRVIDSRKEDDGNSCDKTGHCFV